MFVNFSCVWFRAPANTLLTDKQYELVSYIYGNMTNNTSD